MTKEQFRMHRKPRKAPKPPGVRRRVPLPETRFQVPPDDPDGQRRVRKILESPSYCRLSG